MSDDSSRAAVRTDGASGALWVRVESGLLVGNDRGRYLGSIEVDESGGFLAFGSESQYLGRFTRLDDAKAVAERPTVTARPAATRRLTAASLRRGLLRRIRIQADLFPGT